jgi:hypothetical protein
MGRAAHVCAAGGCAMAGPGLSREWLPGSGKGRDGSDAAAAESVRRSPHPFPRSPFSPLPLQIERKGHGGPAKRTLPGLAGHARSTGGLPINEHRDRCRRNGVAVHPPGSLPREEARGVPRASLRTSGPRPSSRSRKRGSRMASRSVASDNPREAAFPAEGSRFP